MTKLTTRKKNPPPGSYYLKMLSGHIVANDNGPDSPPHTTVLAVSLIVAGEYRGWKMLQVIRT